MINFISEVVVIDIDDNKVSLCIWKMMKYRILGSNKNCLRNETMSRIGVIKIYILKHCVINYDKIYDYEIISYTYICNILRFEQNGRFFADYVDIKCL